MIRKNMLGFDFFSETGPAGLAGGDFEILPGGGVPRGAPPGGGSAGPFPGGGVGLRLGAGVAPIAGGGVGERDGAGGAKGAAVGGSGGEPGGGEGKLEAGGGVGVGAGVGMGAAGAGTGAGPGVGGRPAEGAGAGAAAGIGAFVSTLGAKGDRVTLNFGVPPGLIGSPSLGVSFKVGRGGWSDIGQYELDYNKNECLSSTTPWGCFFG